MSINVYWASVEKEWMSSVSPESVSKRFYSSKKYESNNPLGQMNYCPAFNATLKNLYTMKSLYNYHFYVDDNSVYSDVLSKEFFDEHVVVRAPELKLFSFLNRYTFFTDEKSLEATFYQFPFLEDNNITKSCITIPGKYDIAKWYRNTEFAFYLKDDISRFKIEKDEVYGYVQFHTKKKINFIQYRMSETLRQYAKDGFALNGLNGFAKSMESYYDNFKLKKLILKEIKENIL